MAMSETDTWEDIQNCFFEILSKVEKILPLKIHHNKTLMLFYD